MRALAVVDRPARDTPSPDDPVVIFVHGSLDRGESFARVIRRLRRFRTITYDRRGYQGSRAAGITDFGGHVDDLVSLIEGCGARQVVVVGHSLGGDVAMAGAIAAQGTVAALAAFEPPIPWAGFRRPLAPGETRRLPFQDQSPAEAAESFFKRMISPQAWDRLSEDGREGRRLDGPALVADLQSIQHEGFDVTDLRLPAVFGRGSLGAEHHRLGVDWLFEMTPGSILVEIEGAGHGAHLSHPDAFARMVEQTVAAGLATRAD